MTQVLDIRRPIAAQQPPECVLFLGTEDDVKYIAHLKGLLGGVTCRVITQHVEYLTQVLTYCAKHSITSVVSTNTHILKKLIEKTGKTFAGNKQPALSNYAGSLFTESGIEFVFIDPLKQITTVNHGRFMAQRYISKITQPATWKVYPKFSWTLLDGSNVEQAYEIFKHGFALACDIETFSDPLSIRCIGFTCITIDVHSNIRLDSFVLPIDSMWAVIWMRKFLQLSVPKIFQNGKYDISYLSRYSAPPTSWMWDTANMMHAWYAELPKDLAFLTGFFIRNSMYWKDLAETSDLQEYYRYNALDTYGTALVFIEWFLTAPDWAKQNYLKKFPVNFPSHLCEMTGVKRNEEIRIAAFKEAEALISVKQKSLETMIATPNFNTNSHIQVKTLLRILGCTDLTGSSDQNTLKKAAFRHPLNARILNLVIEIRKQRKLNSTYLGPDKEHNGRILYSIVPHGTDTGRNASREHHFWCGLQIQNIPRGKSVKQTLEADIDFHFGESDLEQAEARDVAYISGDENLISAVSGIRDFHSVNASSFFGIPYESIYSDATKETLNKDLRDTAKRVNHGANYNMGAWVLIDTMGDEAILKAKSLLRVSIMKWLRSQYPTLDVHKLEFKYNIMGLKAVADYLLMVYEKTYPHVKGRWYNAVIHEVMTTQKLVGAAVDGICWTRYCFGNPQKSKQDLNAYVAHHPQSINAMVLDKAFLRVFYDIAIHPTHKKNFKLLAQIHDSIWYMVRDGHEYLHAMVKERMEIPVTVIGSDKKERTFTVPAAVKWGKPGKPARFWSEI